MKTPQKVNNLEYDCDCTCINISTWDKLMQGHTRANHKQINELIKLHLPELYEDLALEYRNPYNYFKTKKHLILVHSSIEYFLAYN